jgi:glutamyl-tRNA synthetase
MASLSGIVLNEMDAEVVLKLMLERVSFLHEVLDATWLFGAPLKEDFDGKMVRKKWKPETIGYMTDLKSMLSNVEPFKADDIETQFKTHLEEKEMGFGQVLLPFRLALTGSGGGPSMFEFAEFLGLEKTLERLDYGIGVIENILLEE